MWREEFIHLLGEGKLRQEDKKDELKKERLQWFPNSFLDFLCLANFPQKKSVKFEIIKVETYKMLKLCLSWPLYIYFNSNVVE